MKLMLALFFTGFCLSCLSCFGQTFYISPRGNDSNPGTCERPFLTIDRAKQAVRKIKPSRKPRAVNIFLRGGRYLLNAPLIFSPEDGGSKLLSVNYLAYHHEKVILSGGKPVTSSWHEVSRNCWVTHISNAGQIQARQLFKNGVRMPRARLPEKDSMFTIASVSPDFRKIILQEKVSLPHLKGEQAEMVLLTNWNVIRVIVDSAVGNVLYLKDPAAWIGHCCCVAKPGMHLYLENAREFLNSPDEWYLDQKTGQLVYEAAASEHPDRERFIIPVIQKMVEVKGTKDHAVSNLHFYGITFCYTHFPLPDSGYRGIQAGFYGYRYGTSPIYMEPAAVEFAYARFCSLEDCTVAHTGASAIGLSAGCYNDGILSTEVFDAGGNGIIVGQRDHPLSIPLYDWKDSDEVPKNNLVYNNFIHDCAVTQFGDVGIFAAFCQYTAITHNTVAHLPYTGISIGFIWDSVATSMRDCMVCYNDIHDVMKLLADGGAIYTLGWQPGSRLKGNLLYHIHRSPYAFGGAPNNAIFLDECSRGLYIKDNISYDVEASSFVRFNRNKPSDHLWGKNYFGVNPAGRNFPRSIAALAGSSISDK